MDARTTNLAGFNQVARFLAALLALLALLAPATPSFAHARQVPVAPAVNAQAGGAYRQYLPSNGVLYAHPFGNQPNKVRSANGTFELLLQQDGNLVLYVISGGYRASIWASGTSGRAVYSLHMQQDGNMVMYGYDGRPMWASNTAGQSGAYLEMQDDGNAVLYRPNRPGRTPVWATGTNARR